MQTIPWRAPKWPAVCDAWHWSQYCYKIQSNVMDPPLTTTRPYIDAIIINNSVFQDYTFPDYWYFYAPSDNSSSYTYGRPAAKTLHLPPSPSDNFFICQFSHLKLDVILCFTHVYRASLWWLARIKHSITYPFLPFLWDKCPLIHAWGCPCLHIFICTLLVLAT